MTHPATSRSKLRAAEQAGVRTVLLLVIAFALGLAVSALFVMRPAGSARQTQVPTLSEGTKTVLKRLDSPLEIRFYSILDPNTVSNSVQVFAGQVDRLLDAYQQDAMGKITLKRFNAASPSGANDASKDGLRAFNRDKGDACYLGLVLEYQRRKEVLPQLTPDWAPALESDLSRAIARLVDSAAPPQLTAAPAPAEAAAAEEVKRAIPNLANVSVEEGTRILREAALKDFKAAASEMETQVKDAQQRLSRAQKDGSAAEQQAAMNHLRQIQAEQTEKLQQIAARSMAQIQAFEQLKAASH